MLSKADASQRKVFHLDETPTTVTPHLYFVRDFNASSKVETRLSLGSGTKRETIEDFAPYAAEFEDHFRELILNIFDPDVPFTQCEDDHHCTFCAFKSYCIR